MDSNDHAEQGCKCTTADCDRDATQVMAFRQAVDCMWVAPYCIQHASDVEEVFDAVPAAGPALSPEAAEIEGIRGEEHHAS